MMKFRPIALIVSILMGAGITVYNYTGTDVTLTDGTTISTEELPKHLTKQYRNRTLEDSLTIFIHHTAVDADVPIENIANYHVNSKDWPGISYHSAIEPDGDILLLNDLSTISYHTRGQNTKGISIVLLGNYEEDQLTDKQLESVKLITEALCEVLKVRAIMGHRDAPGARTTCPGANAQKILEKQIFFR